MVENFARENNIEEEQDGDQGVTYASYELKDYVELTFSSTAPSIYDNFEENLLELFFEDGGLEKLTAQKLEDIISSISIEKTILNYTPHEINIITEDGKTYNFPSIGNARCNQTTIAAGTIGNIPISSTTFGKIEGLPEEKPNAYYIVSRLVKQACPNRRDLLVPNEIIRDETGKIIGCKSLANN